MSKLKVNTILPESGVGDARRITLGADGDSIYLGAGAKAYGFQEAGDGQGPQGPEGDKGEPGIQGETGPQGDSGVDGADGAVGATGGQGPEGAQGPAGTNGLKGDKGDPGAGGGGSIYPGRPYDLDTDFAMAIELDYDIFLMLGSGSTPTSSTGSLTTLVVGYKDKEGFTFHADQGTHAIQAMPFMLFEDGKLIGSWMTSDLGTGAIFTDPRGGIGGSFNGSVQIPLTEFKGNSKTLTRFSEYRWSSSFWGK